MPDLLHTLNSANVDLSVKTRSSKMSKPSHEMTEETAKSSTVVQAERANQSIPKTVSQAQIKEIGDGIVMDFEDEELDYEDDVNNTTVNDSSDDSDDESNPEGEYDVIHDTNGEMNVQVDVLRDKQRTQTQLCQATLL